MTESPDARLDQRLPQIEVRIHVENSAEPLPPPTSVRDFIHSNSKWWIATGTFLLVLSAYVLTNPGRIDAIDGQIRFDVAHNWLRVGRPIVRDPWVGPIMGVPGRGGAVYSYYGAPASILSMPLLWLGSHFYPYNIQSSWFLFSLTSSVIGALIAPVVFLLYLELGVAVKEAILWTLVSSFATLVWPASCTTLDNAQHAFFGIAAVYLGFLSARRRSHALALTGGLMAGVLILYQEYFLLLIPALAISTVHWNSLCEKFPTHESQTEAESALTRLLSGIVRELRFALEVVRDAFRGPGEARSSCLRYLWFCVGVATGLLLSFAYNDLRFGSLFDNGKMRSFAHRHPVWGNPIAGLPTLLISPGKSLLFYSPPLLLGILGIRSLWRRRPEAALMILGASAALISFMSCYAGLGGDWCWGPRYLTVLLPMWALAFPFVPADKIRRDLVLAIVGAGLLVQVLALSAETQRFFFERAFDDHFWAEDPWVYFKHSALLARVGETISLGTGPPLTARFFNSAPVTDWYTYTILGPPPPRSMAPTWMRNFKIYYLPRPWPLWMCWLPKTLRPINLGVWAGTLLSMLLAGVGFVYHGLHAIQLAKADEAAANEEKAYSAVSGKT